MKRDQCSVSAEALTEHDRAELELLETFINRRAAKPDEPTALAYAEVYGEQVYPKKPGGGE